MGLLGYRKREQKQTFSSEEKTKCTCICKQYVRHDATQGA